MAYLLTKFPWVKKCAGEEGHVSWQRGFGNSTGYCRVNGKTLNELFYQYDIYPTIASTTNTTVPYRWFGERFELSLNDYERFKRIHDGGNPNE